MILFPAIDLRGGRCVRLYQGAYDRETVYGEDPVAIARGFEAAGARWLHVVDLDGARAGEPVQHAIVGAICAAVQIPVQVGGGLRSADAVAAVLAAGAARVVIGTMAVENAALAGQLCEQHAGRIAIGLDARDGKVRIAGWMRDSGADAATLAAEVAKLGPAAIIYTDIGRDGTERGPDVDGTRAVARAARIPVIASGGVGTLEHLRALAGLGGDGIVGAIVGRALYTGAIRLTDALGALAED